MYEDKKIGVAKIQSPRTRNSTSPERNYKDLIRGGVNGGTVAPVVRVIKLDRRRGFEGEIIKS